jgi:hypothetical protein
MARALARMARRAFRDAELDQAAASAVALLALAAGQDVEPAEGSDGTDGRWRIARKVAGDRVISTVGPDARHTRSRRRPAATATVPTSLRTRSPGSSPVRS